MVRVRVRLRVGARVYMGSSKDFLGQIWYHWIALENDAWGIFRARVRAFRVRAMNVPQNWATFGQNGSLF